MSVKMKFGSKDIPFVYKGDKLVYPNPIKDGLLLWYDFKGMRNTDTNKEVAKDLSGNGNDGTLTNFNFTEGSGYKDNTLVFDGVDDSLTIPELVLDETAMSVMHDGKLYAYEDDKVMTVDEDGGIAGDGKNLIFDANNFSARYTPRNNVNLKFESGVEIKEWNTKSATRLIATGGVGDIHRIGSNTKLGLPLNTKLTHSIYVKNESKDEVTLRFNTELGLFSSHQLITPNESKRLIITGVGREEYDFVQLHIYAKEATTEEIKVVLWNEKLEFGTNAHPVYSPAPEDYKTTSLSSSTTNLQLYNKVLNKEELLHNAESKGLRKLKPGVPVQDGLLLHYDFSHESNTSEYKDKAFDYSGNGNHGVLNNFNFTEESGYEGGGLKFDGVDDVIDTNLSNLDIGNSTYETVVYYDRQLESQVYQVIMHTYSYWTDGIFLSGNSVRAFINNGTGNNLMYIPPQAKVKIHIVRVVDNVRGVMELYVNGVIVGSTNITSGVVDTRGNNLTLSNLAYTLHHPIYSTKVYNRALTTEEIAHNYAIEREKFNITEGEM